VRKYAFVFMPPCLPRNFLVRAETVSRCAERMAALVKNTLNVAALSDSRFRLSIQKFSVGRMVTDVAEIMSATNDYFGDPLLSSDVQFVTETPDSWKNPDGGSLVEGDEAHICGAIFQVLRNSLQFTKTGHVKYVLQLMDLLSSTVCFWP